MQGDTGIRKPKEGEKHEGRGNQLTEVKNVRSPPSPASWHHFLLKDVNQANDHGLPWLVELLKSVLASSSWAWSKMPARSLQWKGREARRCQLQKTDCQLTIMESRLFICRVVTSGYLDRFLQMERRAKRFGDERF